MNTVVHNAGNIPQLYPLTAIRPKPLVANDYLRLFGYHVADSIWGSIDKPRKLAKSVIVE